MPLISVIVPVYNVEKYLTRCIDSILSQTFVNFELILIDDGSPDNSSAICDDYAKNDSRIVVVHKKNGGVSDARNAGLDIAKGEYLTFVDSDDWIFPEYIERLYYYCVNNCADLSACDFTSILGEPIIESSQVVYDDIETFWCNYHNGAPWGKLFKKNLWGNLRFPFGRDCEDLFTIYKYVFQCKRIVFFSDPLYFYYQNAEGFTNNWSIKQVDNLDALEEQIHFFLYNRYDKALQSTCLSFVYNITRHVSYMDSFADDRYKMKKRQLIKRGKKVLIDYKKHMKSLNEWEYYCFYFFPFEMKTRDYYLAFKRTLKNGGPLLLCKKVLRKIRK